MRLKCKTGAIGGRGVRNIRYCTRKELMFNVDINFLPQPFELIIYIYSFFFLKDDSTSTFMNLLMNIKSLDTGE